MLVFEVIFLFSVGIIVGVMNAIAGGGMMIGFPALIAVGMPPLAATATSSIIVMPGLASALVSYRKHLRRIPQLYWLLLLPCLAGAFIGASLLRNTSFEAFESYIPALLGVAVLLFIFQPFMHFHFHRHLHGKTKRILPIVLIGVALFPLAVYGGYFGVGFGFVLLAFLGFSNLRSIHKINALKSIAALVITLTTFLVLVESGLIDWQKGLIMAVGCAVGGYYGAHYAQRFSSHAIRVVVIAVGVSAVIGLCIKYY